MKKEGIGLIGAILCAGLGYLLVMAPWLLRNYAKYGTLLSPGASRAIWERSYNELFNYPPATLNFANWWAQGMSVLLRQRWEALLANLQTVLGVQMEILLAPFVAIGLWRMRKEKLVQLACLAWGFILFAMSVVYPFAGARGGFFHSGSAIQPVVWAAAACGFEAVIAWAARMRKWDAQTALNRFMPGISLFIILITAFNYLRVLGPDLAHPAWNGDVVYYGRIEAELRKMDPSQTASVMVNNPAGYSLVSERPAYVIPNGGSDTLLAVARRYQVRYVILDANLPDDLFAEVGATRTIPGLVDLAKIDQASILRVEEK